MKNKIQRIIRVLDDRSDNAGIVRWERFYGTEDEVIERTCVFMGSELRADVTPD